jgi:hypothetical protein
MVKNDMRATIDTGDYHLIGTDPKDGETDVYDFTKYRPLRGGIKISISRATRKGHPPDEFFAGTMGLLALTKENPPRHVLLTNWHVIQNVAPHGPVGQPHPDPGSTCSACGSELVGNILGWAKDPNFADSAYVLLADAAICALNEGMTWRAAIAHHDVGDNLAPVPIAGIRDIRIPQGSNPPPALKDLPVKKRGMKSPPATGTVGVFNVGHPITVDGKTFFGVEIDGVSFSAPIFQVVADTPPLSVPGDSGNVICDFNDNVVGLLFSSKPDRMSALAFHIQPVLDALNLTIPTGNSHPGVQTVPANNNPYAEITISSQQHAMEKLQNDLLQTAHGTPLVRTLFKHVPEIRGLIQTNLRAAAAWRSAGGADVIEGLLAAVRNPDLPLLPGEAAATRGAARRLARVLHRFGSERLRADLDRLAAAANRLIGLSYRDLLDKLNIAPVI